MGDKLTPADYVHLHNHTQYSLLDGLTKVPDLMDFVKSDGMTAVAQTDHGTLSGAIEFYKEAKARGVKPIIGMEGYVAARTISDKEPGKDKAYYHIILLAMNEQGYRNLMRLSTIACLEGFYYKPRVDRVLLEKYNEGLIVLSGCIGGELGEALRQGQRDKAGQTVEWYKRVFGDRYYIEVQDHGHPEHPSSWVEQQKVNEQLLKLADEYNVPAVVTCDAHYLSHEDQEAHEILLCVQTGSFLSDEKRMSLAEFELHVQSAEEVIKRWGKTHPELIVNTRRIADRCEINIELGNILIPKFPVPDGEDEKSYLEKLVWRGLAWRYGGMGEDASQELTPAQAQEKLPQEVIDRARFELDIIGSMGFNGYFLIISDFIMWGKANGIVFGPGRGSAAGSVISYALKITDLDPLKYDLLFERFLNPDRISMPDIDIDIQDTRRDEVIEYCVQKYGKDRVANIVTFGRMAARNAVRDVARVLQVPYSDADRLAKMIPPPIQGRHIPLKTSLKENAELKQEYESNETAQRVFDLATQLEGTIRSHGVHAAGVVIAPDEIVGYVPLEMAQKGVIATQYPMNPVDELGLLKIDFLGLSNLTIIKNALRIIKRVYDKDIDIIDISLDDSQTFKLLAEGDTTGVFQLESAGMKRYLKELKPTVFEDIIAMVALYRPGPMQFIDDFISRKHGQKQIEYMHPKMEAALQNTYGVLVYQEQVMQISKDLCGFTGGQSDTLRKGIGKKIPEIMAKMKAEFIEGGIKHSEVARADMEKLWKQLEDFAAYCFNKSHAACYGLIAYWTAYLKAHYPSAFMAALMTSDAGDTDRLAIEITECKHMGLAVLSPDVNESFSEFAVVPDTNQIRFGLGAIKNVGTHAVEEILRAREDGGEFVDLEDFFTRVSSQLVNRKALESLVRAGAFDRYGDRSDLVHNLDLMLAYANRQRREAQSGQTDLFGSLGDEAAKQHKPKLSLEPAPVKEPPKEQLTWERDLLGLYLSRDPLEEFGPYLAEHTTPLNQLSAKDPGSISIGGSVLDVREIMTKNGQKMAFAKVEDQFGEIELIVFPKVYEDTSGLWERDRVILAKGKLSGKDRDGNPGGELKVLVDEAREITVENVANHKPGRKRRSAAAAAPPETIGAPASVRPAASKPAEQRVYIRLLDTSDQKLLFKLKQIIDEHQGSVAVVLIVGTDGKKQIIKLPGGVSAGQPALERLRALAGADNVKTG